MTATQFATIYLVRHGQTEWNVQKITQGHQDSPLTALGREQVSALKQELDSVHFDLFLTSDLGRAKETAEILNLERRMAVVATKALRERTFGRLEGRRSSEYRQELREEVERYERLNGDEAFRFKLVPDMESDHELVTRILRYLREVGVAYPGKTILMVTHGGVIRTLLAHLGFADIKELPGGSMSNAGYIKLRTDGVDFFLDEVQGVTKKVGSE